MIKDISDLTKTIFDLYGQADGPAIVAVDGCGGSGKSTFAARLSKAFEGAVLVHTDDFASWENPLGWWPRMVEQVLKPLKQGIPARYQRYDWSEKRLAEWHEVKPNGVVIVEGVSSSRKEFREYIHFSVWVECPREVRLARGLARDGEGMATLWSGWMKDEDEYIARDNPRDNANLVINGNPADGLVSESEVEILSGDL